MRTGTDVVIELLVDDGMQNRAHRANIVNDEYGCSGNCSGPHKAHGFMTCQSFAAKFESKSA